MVPGTQKALSKRQLHYGHQDQYWRLSFFVQSEIYQAFISRTLPKAVVTFHFHKNSLSCPYLENKHVLSAFGLPVSFPVGPSPVVETTVRRLAAQGRVKPSCPLQLRASLSSLENTPVFLFKLQGFATNHFS